MPTHHDYFKQAQLVAQQATCQQAYCGSVVVAADGTIIGKGYNAPPLADELQRMCTAEFDLSIKPSSDKTCCVHAEWNAILDALKNHSDQIDGATLYFMRVNKDGACTEAGEPWCTVCSRLALQSGIKQFGLWNNGPDMRSTTEYNLKSYQYFS